MFLKKLASCSQNKEKRKRRRKSIKKGRLMVQVEETGQIQLYRCLSFKNLGGFDRVRGGLRCPYMYLYVVTLN